MFKLDVCIFVALALSVYSFRREVPMWESYPYSPSKRLNECDYRQAKTVPEAFANCRAECKALGYPWGTCVPIAWCGFWYPMCSCFSKPFHKLPINTDFLHNPLLYKEVPPFECEPY